MEATCPHCQARLNVPAPGAYACGNCGKRVDVASESGSPAPMAPPAPGAYGLEPPSTPPPGSVPAPGGFPPPPPLGMPGTIPPSASPQPSSWAAQGPPPGAIGAPGLPPTGPTPGGFPPPPFGGATIPGVAPSAPYGAPHPEYAVPPVVNPAEQAPCANHPGNAASGVCERCGDFMCRLCTTTVEGRNYCPKCFDLLYNRGSLQFTQRQFTLPGVSFGLGIAAFLSSCMCFISIALGIAGIWTGVRSLKEYGERPDLPNRWMAITGIVLSTLGILEGVGMIAYFVISAMQSGH